MPGPAEAREAILALHAGEADAIVVQTPEGEGVYTLENINRPYRLFVEQMQEGALTIGDDGTIHYCNQRFADMLGATVEGIIGRSLDEFIATSSLSDYHHLRERGRHETARGECALKTLSDELLRVQVCFSPLRPRRMRYSSVIVTDLTHVQRQKELTAARETAEQENLAKDRFLAMLSHELRTPLNTVLGWAQMLRRKSFSKEDRERALETIERNTRAQMQLINDLLDVSRIVSGKLRLDMQLVNPADIAGNALESVASSASQKRQKVHCDLDHHAGLVTADSGRLRQAIVNLLNNAVKFTPIGGEVTMTQKRVDGHIEIAVSDTGQGISPEALPLIFNRFQQGGPSGKHDSGLGLGLYIVKKIMNMHGGEVAADSAGEGRGSTFTLRLPITAVAPEEERNLALPRLARKKREEEPAQQSPVRLDGLRVLVVDDDNDALAMMQASLSQIGAEVMIANNTTDGLRMAKEIAPDVLISDLHMPDEDGFDFIRRLRREGISSRDLPAVALTALARPEDRRRAMLSGFQVHVAKPVEHEELVAAIIGVSSLSGVVVP